MLLLSLSPKQARISFWGFKRGRHDSLLWYKCVQQMCVSLCFFLISLSWSFVMFDERLSLQP